MISFKDFLISENESDIKINELKSNISKAFSEIEKYKKEKKAGDLNSEVNSITNQANEYIKISGLMKSLAAELKKSAAGPKKVEGPLY